MTKRKLPEGVTCEACGKFDKYPSYVYAHWNTPLVYTCHTEGCGKKYVIIGGTATPMENDSDRRKKGT